MAGKGIPLKWPEQCRSQVLNKRNLELQITQPVSDNFGRSSGFKELGCVNTWSVIRHLTVRLGMGSGG